MLLLLVHALTAVKQHYWFWYMAAPCEQPYTCNKGAYFSELR